MGYPHPKVKLMTVQGVNSLTILFWIIFVRNESNCLGIQYYEEEKKKKIHHYTHCVASITGDDSRA